MIKKHPVIPLIDLREHLQIERERAPETPWQDLGKALLYLAWVTIKALLVFVGLLPNPRVTYCPYCLCECRRQQVLIADQSAHLGCTEMAGRRAQRQNDYAIYVESMR